MHTKRARSARYVRPAHGVNSLNMLDANGLGARNRIGYRRGIEISSEQHGQHDIDLHRLRQNVTGSLSDGTDRRTDVAVATLDHDACSAQFCQRFDDLKTIAVNVFEFNQCEIGHVAFKLRLGSGNAAWPVRTVSPSERRRATSGEKTSISGSATNTLAFLVLDAEDASGTKYEDTIMTAPCFRIASSLRQGGWRGHYTLG